MHDLRHTFASHLIMRNRSIVEVQQLMGHSTIQMTMRYAHLTPEVKRDAVEALDTGSVVAVPAPAVHKAKPTEQVATSLTLAKGR